MNKDSSLFLKGADCVKLYRLLLMAHLQYSSLMIDSLTVSDLVLVSWSRK